MKDPENKQSPILRTLTKDWTEKKKDKGKIKDFIKELKWKSEKLTEKQPQQNMQLWGNNRQILKTVIKGWWKRLNDLTEKHFLIVKI